MARSRITVKEIAKQAGVSVGTVSNVLNRPELVSPEVLQRVQTVMGKNNFVRNTAAVGLRRGHSLMVGMLVLDLNNPFFMEAASEVEKTIREQNYLLTIAASHSDVVEETVLLQSLAAQQVAGILLTPISKSLNSAHELSKRGTKVVLFDSDALDPYLSSVAVDDRLGAKLAVEYLIEQGHRRVLFINGPRQVRQSISRRKGVRDAWEAAGLPDENLIEVTAGQFDVKAGEKAVTQFVELIRSDQQFPTAIFCANDLLAFGVINILQAEGIQIPQQVSVIGFDDIPMASQCSVPLTTIRQPMRDLGRIAAQLLLDSENQVQHLLLKPELIPRQTTL